MPTAHITSSHLPRIRLNWNNDRGLQSWAYHIQRSEQKPFDRLATISTFLLDGEEPAVELSTLILKKTSYGISMYNAYDATGLKEYQRSYLSTKPRGDLCHYRYIRFISMLNTSRARAVFLGGRLPPESFRKYSTAADNFVTVRSKLKAY